MGEDEGKICFNCAAWHGEGRGPHWCVSRMFYKHADEWCDKFEPKQNREEIGKMHEDDDYRKYNYRRIFLPDSCATCCNSKAGRCGTRHCEIVGGTVSNEYVCDEYEKDLAF